MPRREICVSKSNGLPFYLGVNLPFLLCFTLYLWAILQVQGPKRHEFGGLIFGGAYFPNFTVSLLRRLIVTTYLTQPIFKHEYSLNFFIKLLLGVLIEER